MRDGRARLAIRVLGTTLGAALFASCVEPTAAGGPTALMSFAADDPFAAPFPSEHLRDADGAIDLSSFPTRRTTIVEQIHDALSDAPGFGTTSAIQLTFSAPLDPSVLALGEPLEADDALVQLVDVDPHDAEHRGERAPIRLFYGDTVGPFGGANVLTALPVQGMPLHAETLYALIVRRGLATLDGTPMGAAPEMSALARGEAPAGLEGAALEAYRTAYEGLADAGIEGSDVLAMAVFRTQDPVGAMRRAVETTTRTIRPSAPFAADEVFDDYCVFHTTIPMPVFQDGEPPYASEGGAWVWDGEGHLVLDHEEDANLVVTLPRQPMPPDGFPLTVLIRTGAGGDRPLVDRGPHAVAHGEPIAPGHGPARDFAQVGWAGLTVDGPHGGLRNVTHADEQFLVFNIQNPRALRDNLRQSALELVLMARALGDLRIDASSCPGLEEPQARFDASRVTLMGHSMGASIAPLAAAFEPTYDGLILSGAGASWLENVLHKQSPIATRPLAEGLLGYTRLRLELTEADPVLNLLQWAGEEADAAVYAPLLLRDAAPGTARHILMFQGIVDTYIPPQVANALTIALGIDLAGQAIDREDPRLSGVESVLDVLPLRGRDDLAYPVRENLHLPVRAVTAAVAQHPDDGIEDGHETMWQTEPPRAQFRCFLHTMSDAAPTVADPSALPAGCE
ncbi:MAG: hypothetical protein K1X94_06860 [Sandaracinaceae bacterium]|nr:hypothetical protein [Sandaracinaceae bacterium]